MNFEVESAKDLLISVTSNLLSYNDGEIIPYKEIYSFKKEKEDLFFFDINCNNEIKTTLNNLLDQRDNIFNFTIDNVSNISFYVIELDLGNNENIFLFKKYQSVKQVYGKKYFYLIPEYLK